VYMTLIMSLGRRGFDTVGREQILSHPVSLLGGVTHPVTVRHCIGFFHFASAGSAVLLRHSVKEIQLSS
jgi:hypothetical protein